MNFQERMMPVVKGNQFKDRGYYTWCGAMTKEGDKYGLLYSRWPHKTGLEGWVICSEICLATSDSPYGPFKFEKVLLTRVEGDTAWDRHSFHNPCILENEGKYYLYYMGNHGDGTFWSHRNNQRIGLAVADSMYGPFKRMDKPILDVGEEGFDSLMTSNPTVVKRPDGKFLMMYKAVNKDGKPPWGGDVLVGTALAEKPDGPFVKANVPLMHNPNHFFSIEDPGLFYYKDKCYCLVKDMRGYFTGTNEKSMALFYSDDELCDFKPCEDFPLASDRTVKFTDGTSMQMSNLERPQVYIEDGKPKVLCCAVAEDKEWTITYNVQIPLDFE